MGDDVKVSDAEMQKVEAQVKAAEQNERGAIEERIRKELTLENRAKELESQLLAQQKAFDDATKDAAKAREESDAMAKRLAEQRVESSRSKAPIVTTNPFRVTETGPTITRDMVPGIELASLDALRERSRKK